MTQHGRGGSPRSFSSLSSARISRRDVLRGGAAAAGAVGIGQILAACGATASPSPSAQRTTGPAPTAGSSPAASLPTGGKVTLGTTNTFQDFDPYPGTRLNNPSKRAFYSRLIDYTDNLEPIPQAAEDWEVASDHRSVTIKLREAVFHSGADVTANDIIAGVERAKDRAIAGNLVAFGQLIRDATAVDSRTVRVNFIDPVPDGTITDLMFWFPVVEASKNNPDALKQAPAGSGAFLFESLDPGVSLVMKRNPNYWDAPRPYVDEVEYRFLGDQAGLVSALQTNVIDIALYVDAAQVGELERDFDLMMGGPNSTVGVLYLNTRFPPFDNKLVRQAMRHAVNRERIVQDVRFGYSEPVYGPFTVGSPAFDPAYLEELAFDLNKAKALLEQSGAEMVGDIFVHGRDPARLQIAQILQSDLATIDFRLNINVLEITTFSTEFANGGLSAALTNAGSTLNTPSDIARSAAFQLGEGNSMWGANVPQAWIDAVEAARTAITPDAREAAFAQMNEVLADEAWAIGIEVWPEFYLINRRVTGFNRDQGQVPLLENVRVG